MSLLAITVVADKAIPASKPPLTEHIFAEHARDPFAIINGRSTITIRRCCRGQVVIPGSYIEFCRCLHVLITFSFWQ